MLAAGETTSESLVRHLLARIAEIDAPDSAIALRSIIAISPTALVEAIACDAERAQGNLRGPLHGLPVLVKDNIEARGGSWSKEQEEAFKQPIPVTKFCDNKMKRKQ
mgnify:CR=1 FL=1